jgi:hypothetical protein
MVYGNKGLKGRLAILEGQKHSGWQGFCAELHFVLEPWKKSSSDIVVASKPDPRNELGDGEIHHG